MSPEKLDAFYALKFGAMWHYFKVQHYSFKMICFYLLFEFVRPQALFPAIDFVPWAQLFVLGSLVGFISDPTVKWISSPANKWMFVFLVTIIVSILTANYPDISKKHFMDFFSWFIIYFLIIGIVNTKERLYIFLIIYILAAAKIALGTSKTWAFRGFSFTSWGLMGPRGYFQNSGELAILMLMLFPLAFYLYQASKDKIKLWEKIALILFWVCPILTILGASSRGAQIALAVQLLIMFRKSIVRPKTLILVCLFCAALFHILPAEQKERFAHSGDDKTSQQRLLYWGHGWEMIKDNPVTGVGLFNFIPYYEQHFSQDMLYEHAELPHNIFIQIATDAGILAVFSFFMIIFYCIHTCYKLSIKWRDNLASLWSSIAAGLGFGVFGFLIAGQFVTVGYYPFLWIHLALIASLANVAQRLSVNNDAES